MKPIEIMFFFNLFGRMKRFVATQSIFVWIEAYLWQSSDFVPLTDKRSVRNELDWKLNGVFLNYISWFLFGSVLALKMLKNEHGDTVLSHTFIQSRIIEYGYGVFFGLENKELFRGSKDVKILSKKEYSCENISKVKRTKT